MCNASGFWVGLLATRELDSPATLYFAPSGVDSSHHFFALA
jgi:hypothetical protein